MKKIFTFLFAMMAFVLGLNATVYCHEAITKDGKTIYLSTIQVDETHYQMLIESDVDMDGLGGSFMEVNGVAGYQLNADGHAVVAADKKSITIDVESSVAPRLYTPLYVMMPGEVNFGEFNDIEYGECTQEPAAQLISATTFIDMSEMTAGTYKENFNVGPLLGIADAEKAITIDSNTKKNGEHSFTQRLKFSGTGKTTNNQLHAKVAGKCTVNIYALSGKNTETRQLNIDLNEFQGAGSDATHYATLDCVGSYSEGNDNIPVLSFEYTGEEAATLIFYSNNSGINIYAIEFVFPEVEVPVVQENLALNKPAVAGFEATPVGEALDGNLASRWGTNGGQDGQHWFYVDLGAVYDIQTIKIYFEGAYADDYSLYTSLDAQTWTEIGSYNEMPTIGNTEEAVNTYTFTNAQGRFVRFYARSVSQWGVSLWEFEVYGTAADITDNEAPVMGEASLVSVTHNTAVIAVDATDNTGVAAYHVVDAAHSIDITVSAIDGKLNITGLEQNTEYSFVITAIDLVNNESANNATVAATTVADNTRPWTAPAEPTFDAADVINIFSGAYEAPNPGWSFGAGWWHGAQFSIVSVDGNEIQLYQNAPADGVTGAQVAEFDATGMTHFYFNVWAQEAGTVRMKLVSLDKNAIGEDVNIDLDSDPIDLVGGEWQTVDLKIADVFPTANLQRVFQFGVLQPSMPNLAFDNILLHKVTEGGQTALQMIENTGIRFANNMVYNHNNVSMQIFNVQGQKVADTTADFDMSAMPNGIYMVRANNAVLKIRK